ncbi:MCE family protein [Rhodococcus erythropolis]|uniref:MCE family protein n=1 Tax=Rhodococcus erythropolis TaxID=1833 RepID=UPI001E40C501|nr:MULTISPECIES: MCE family protein [Rhodococcus erythropolis group]MCD2107915.1 MCE family protein [Rhodococcus qingshengii]MCZ4527086.1 MCE family protein [Rhodococcus erythropolis]
MNTRRTWLHSTLIFTAAIVCSSCGWSGLNTLALPGTAGRGDDAFSVVIEMPDVSTLERNSRVLVSDVTVGRVADIKLTGSHAEVTVDIDGTVDLPGNATAKVGQTSLLGSTHVELSAPLTTPAVGSLGDGSVIPLENAGNYPTTEQTLASVSLVLRGGGLAQIHDVTTELNEALSGREGSVRNLLSELDTLLSGLDEQKQDIIRAIDNLDTFTRTVAEQKSILGTALSELQPALGVIDDRRTGLTQAMVSLGQLGATATEIVEGTHDDIVIELQQLEPVLKSLADSGTSLTESSRYLLTYPFPIDTYPNVVRGDYANGEVTLDLTLSTLDNALLLGTPLQGSLIGLENILGHVSPNSMEPVRQLPNVLVPLLGGTP